MTSIIGQSAAIEEFWNTCRSGKIPQSWIFTGPKGIGKSTFALYAARELLAGTISAKAIEIADKLAIVRSAQWPLDDGHHLHLMFSGFRKTDERPSFGSIVSRVRAERGLDDPLPPYVSMAQFPPHPVLAGHEEPTYVGAAHRPFVPWPAGECLQEYCWRMLIDLPALLGDERLPAELPGDIGDELWFPILCGMNGSEWE